MSTTFPVLWELCTLKGEKCLRAVPAISVTVNEGYVSKVHLGRLF